MRFKTIQQTFFFGLLILITIAFLWLIRDFIFPIFWAIVFAVIFYPVHLWWVKVVKGRTSLASALTILSLVFLILTPIFFLSSLIVSESLTLYQQIAVNGTAETSINILEKIETATVYLERFGIDQNSLQEKITSLAQNATAWLGSQALVLGQSTFRVTLLFFVMLYVLFFLFRDGNALQKRITDILPLGSRREKKLIQKFTSTTRATMKGTFLIALIQGTIGGILFAIAGISSPLLWGILMAFVSIIPAIGPALIWLPAGVILLLTGALWQAAVVLIGGAVIISLIDNLLRPALVGKDTQMPDVLILLSTLGGLTLFGIAGIILGPVVAAFFLAMWYMFEEEYKHELETEG